MVPHNSVVSQNDENEARDQDSGSESRRHRPESLSGLHRDVLEIRGDIVAPIDEEWESEC